MIKLYLVVVICRACTPPHRFFERFSEEGLLRGPSAVPSILQASSRVWTSGSIRLVSEFFPAVPLLRNYLVAELDDVRDVQLAFILVEVHDRVHEGIWRDRLPS